jgi:hypothetical protein
LRVNTHPNGLVCLWCGRAFTPRRDGGKRQVFCDPVCRRDLDASGRRWVAQAIATGVLTVQELKNGPTPTRALLSAAVSPAPEGGEAPLQHPAPVEHRAESSYTRQQNLERLMAQAIAMRRRG